MIPETQKPEHNQAIIGGGLAGVCAALELLSHGHEVGEPSGADVRVHLYEAMPESEMFNRTAMRQRDHYPSSSAIGSRSVRLGGAETLEETHKVARSAKLYQRVHKLAEEYGIYKKLSVDGYPDMQNDTVIVGQPYITMASSQNKDAFLAIDKQIASIRLQQYNFNTFRPIWRGVALSREELPYADIVPPIDNLPATDKTGAMINRSYARRLDHYLGELRAFCDRYPASGYQMKERFSLQEWIHRPASEWLAAGKHAGNTPLPRILVEREWTPAHPERHALSLNINQFLQVSIELMRALYQDKFVYHSGHLVNNMSQNAQGIALSSVKDGNSHTAQYDQIVLCGGPYMKGILDKVGIPTELVAAPYVEFPVPGDKINAILKGEAIPAKHAVTIDLGNGIKQTFTAKTLSRNGAWMVNGSRKGDWLKIQFDEKLPLNQLPDITQLPSLQPHAGGIAKQFAEGLGISFTDEMQQASRGRWCPQTSARHPQTKEKIVLAGPVSGAITESFDGRVDSSTANRVYVLGPGMGHGAQLLGGNAHLVAAQMQDRPHKLPVNVQSFIFPQVNTPQISGKMQQHLPSANDNVVINATAPTSNAWLERMATQAAMQAAASGPSK